MLTYVLFWICLQGNLLRLRQRLHHNWHKWRTTSDINGGTDHKGKFLIRYKLCTWRANTRHARFSTASEIAKLWFIWEPYICLVIKSHIMLSIGLSFLCLSQIGRKRRCVHAGEGASRTRIRRFCHFLRDSGHDRVERMRATGGQSPQ